MSHATRLAHRLSHVGIMTVAFGVQCTSCTSDSATESDIASGVLAETYDAAATGPRQQSGWNALVRWDAVPALQQSTTRIFTSRERPDSGLWIPYDAGNKDFNNFIAVCGVRPAVGYQYVDDPSYACPPGEEGYLLAAADGPGFISRVALGLGSLDVFAQTASGIPIQAQPTTERIRIYVDDGGTPVYEGTWLDWTRGATPPFQAPLAGYSSGITYNYLPISYARNVRVFADDLNPAFVSYYYQVTTRTSEPTAPFNAAELTTASAQADLAEVQRSALEASGAESWFDDTLTLPASGASSVWERNLAGTVKRLTIAVDAASAEQVLKQIALRLYWEADAAPAIDASLSELFGQRQGLSEFETWPMRARSAGEWFELTFTLPMPFASHAKLELVNTAETTLRGVRVRVDGVNETPSDLWGRLHTSRQAKSRPAMGERFDVVDLTGPGKYVGTMMYMLGGPYAFGILPGPHPLNFLEGDDRIEVDGVVSEGTGTEETFNGGWYFRDGPYNGALSALIRMNQQPEQGEIAAVRWNILSDSVDFRDHFRFSYEYGANHPETAFEYVSLSFYYR